MVNFCQRSSPFSISLFLYFYVYVFFILYFCIRCTALAQLDISLLAGRPTEIENGFKPAAQGRLTQLAVALPDRELHQLRARRPEEP